MLCVSLMKAVWSISATHNRAINVGTESFEMLGNVVLTVFVNQFNKVSFIAFLRKLLTFSCSALRNSAMRAQCGDSILWFANYFVYLQTELNRSRNSYVRLRKDKRQ